MNTISTNHTPLTRENAALALVDHQVGRMTGIRDYSPSELKHNVVGLAKAAKILGLPIITTTTSADTLWGPAFPELAAALPDQGFIDHTTVNAWDDSRVQNAIKQIGVIPPKVEDIHQRVFKTRREARLAIFDYIEIFYNR